MVVRKNRCKLILKKSLVQCTLFITSIVYSHEGRFNLFVILTNSTQRILCIVVSGGRKLVTFRSLVRRFANTPPM